MAILLKDADVKGLLSMDEVIQAVERGSLEQSRGEVRLPKRTTVDVGAGWIRLMPVALIGSGVMGFKEMHLTKGVGVRYLVNLFDIPTGALLATMDANWITAFRTAATSALAARYLARPEVPRVGVLGSGEQARAHLLALARVRRFVNVRVHSPRAERREAFCAWIRREFQCDAQPVPDPQEAVAGADLILVTIRASGTPVLRAEWLRPGVHVIGISSVRPDAREIDDAVWKVSDRIVVNDRAHVLDSGDGRSAVASGSLRPDDAVELWQLVSGQAPGRQRSDEITLFKSVGTAIQDLAVARTVYERARQRGIGLVLGEFPHARP